ncbi:MAG: YdcF family protein [Desulfatibacillum sp.]|nr:YdcF family protein [Desulfatibacillum sp.]
MKPADAVVVFDGSRSRVIAGYELVNQGLGESLVVSPASAMQLARYDAAFGLPEGVEHLVEDKARTTFENALLTSRIIIDHGWEKVILITHRYHMPRSYFFLRIILAGHGVDIKRYTVEPGTRNGRKLSRFSRMKIYYNEMIDMWGSLGEWAVYIVRGHLPKKSNKESRILNLLKGVIQFDVNGLEACLSFRPRERELPCGL